MEERQTTPPEIDLIYFFRPLTRWFRQFIDWIMRMIRLLMANMVLFLSIFILGSLAGYSLRYIIKPAYRTEAYFITRGMPPKFCSLQLEGLNNNFEAIPRLLQISPEVAGTIKSIRSGPLVDTATGTRRDSIMTPNVLSVQLTLIDIRYIDTIQHALVNYLENNTYMQARKKVRIQSLLQLKESMDKKLQSLDSLKKIVNSSIIPRSGGQGIILGEPVNPVSIYQAETAYYRDKLRIDEDLQLINNIEVIQPFNATDRPNTPNFNALTVKAVLLSLVLAGLITLLFGKKRMTDRLPSSITEPIR